MRRLRKKSRVDDMENEVLTLLKARLGISAQSRDAVLNMIIGGIVAECKDTYGIVLDAGKPNHILFVLDWAAWKYSHPEDGVTPRSIQFRLKNLVIQKAGRADETDDVG